MVDIWWTCIELLLSQFQVSVGKGWTVLNSSRQEWFQPNLKHLPIICHIFLAVAHRITLSLSRLVSNIVSNMGSGEKAIRSAWWSFDPGDFGQGLEGFWIPGLDSSWMMLESGVFTKGSKGSKFWRWFGDFLESWKILFQILVLFLCWRFRSYVSSMFGVSGVLSMVWGPKGQFGQFFIKRLLID